MFKQLLKQAFIQKYSSKSTALFWIVIQPVSLLAVYALVFGYLFKARVAGLTTEQFVAYLAVGLWPWLAFSEALLSSVDAVTQRRDLIGKVHIDSRLFVLTQVVLNYITHFLGFCVVLCFLVGFGLISLNGMAWMALLPWVLYFTYNLVLGLILSAFQVFMKNTKLVMSALIPLLFFSAPIIYSKDIIPPVWRDLMMTNPIFFNTDLMHKSLFFGGGVDVSWLLFHGLLLMGLLFLGNAFFQRLAPQFDDYL